MQKITFNMNETVEIPKVSFATRAIKLYSDVDNFFFCEEDQEIKPYFYTAISIGLLVSLLVIINL